MMLTDEEDDAEQEAKRVTKTTQSCQCRIEDSQINDGGLFVRQLNHRRIPVIYPPTLDKQGTKGSRVPTPASR